MPPSVSNSPNAILFPAQIDESCTGTLEGNAWRFSASSQDTGGAFAVPIAITASDATYLGYQHDRSLGTTSEAPLPSASPAEISGICSPRHGGLGKERLETDTGPLTPLISMIPTDGPSRNRWATARPDFIFGSRLRVMALFLVIDLLIFVDRGIVPGAHNEFVIFMTQSERIRMRPELFYGLLQSVFIGGLAMTAPIFAFLAAKTARPVQLLVVGLTIWLLSISLCFLSGVFNSVTILFVGRLMSGVGEGAFVTLMAPVLVDAQSQAAKGLFLGLFYGLMPCGTAIGFIGSAELVTHITWFWSFGLLAMASIVPIAIVAQFALTPASNGISPLKHFGDPSADLPLEPLESSPRVTASGVFATSGLEHISSTRGSQEGVAFLSVLGRIMKSPVFLGLLLAGSAHASLACSLTSFGVAFLQDLQVFTDELTASIVTAIGATLAGAVGVITGGWLLDRVLQAEEKKVLEGSEEQQDGEPPTTASGGLEELDAVVLDANDSISEPGALAVSSSSGSLSVSPTEAVGGPHNTYLRANQSACVPLMATTESCVNREQSARSVSSLCTVGGLLTWFPRARQFETPGDIPVSPDGLPISQRRWFSRAALPSETTVRSSSRLTHCSRIPRRIIRVPKILVRKLGDLLEDEQRLLEILKWPRETSGDVNHRMIIVNRITKLIASLAVVAGVLMTLTSPLLYALPAHPFVSLATVMLGMSLIFMTQSGLNLSVMWSVPPLYRSLSITVYTLGLHTLGDVPSPIWVGWMKDGLAPHCRPLPGGAIAPGCLRERTWLLLALFAMLSMAHFIWIGLLGAQKVAKTVSGQTSQMEQEKARPTGEGQDRVGSEDGKIDTLKGFAVTLPTNISNKSETFLLVNRGDNDDRSVKDERCVKDG